MKKRDISESNENNNLLGYEVNDEGFIVSRTKFGCKTEWIELNKYCWKLNIKLQWIDSKAFFIFYNSSPCHANYLNEALFECTHNQFHNILRLFDVLPNFPFTTSEMMADYYL